MHCSDRQYVSQNTYSFHIETSLSKGVGYNFWEHDTRLSFLSLNLSHGPLHLLAPFFDDVTAMNFRLYNQKMRIIKLSSEFLNERGYYQTSIGGHVFSFPLELQ